MVLFGGACVVLFGGAYMVLFRGVCLVLFGGRAWFYSGGRACFYSGGHAWFYLGGHAWFYSGGACVVLFGGRAWFFQFFRIQWDTVNERAVRILLECILVITYFYRTGGEGAHGTIATPSAKVWKKVDSSASLCPFTNMHLLWAVLIVN